MSEERLAVLIQAHLERYPESEIMDVYKLLHQATFGPGHAIADKKAAREWLEQEAGQVAAAPAAPLVENIDPNGEMVRVYLGPYLARQGTIKALLEAMIRAGNAVQGDPDRMVQRWQTFEALCQPGGPLADHFDLREVVLQGRRRAEELWPAVRHSPRYESVYHPVYRVLTRGEAESLLRQIQVPFEVV